MNKKAQPIRRYYWDANVFIHLIEGTPEHIATLVALLNLRDEGKVEIYTSVITIAEVAWVAEEKEKRKPTPEMLEKINSLWHPKSGIQMIDAYMDLMIEARDLMRLGLQNGYSGLKPIDALHIISAKRADVQEMHCYERCSKLEKFGQLVGVKITQPVVDSLSLFDIIAEPQE